MTADALPADVDWAYLQTLKDRFPQYLAILSKPGVWPVIKQASDEHWTSDRLFAALQNTEYFRTTTDSQRQFDYLAATNPATAHQQVADIDRTIRTVEMQLGLVLDDTTRLLLALNATQNGWDENRIRAEVVALGGGNPHLSPGLIGDQMSQLQGIADNYGITPSHDQLYWTAANIFSGSATKEGFEDSMRQQAMALFPALTPWLQNGHNVAEFASPYFNMATQELDINPNQIDLRNPAWQDLFIAKDDKGAQGIRSMSEARSALRTDPRYGYDQGLPGRTQASQFATQLLTEFGALG